jgi:hypothetical protein
MIKALSLMGQLGYGYHKKSFLKALDEGIDFIGVDAGSIDSGPYFLGSGNMKANYEATRNDLEFPLTKAVEMNIPFIIGSAGYAGGDAHLNKMIKIIKDIAKDNNLHFKMAVIHSEFDKEFIKNELKNGNIKSYEGNKPLSIEDINQSTRIVGQMGVEKIIEALNCGCSVIVAGRATDASIYAAYPLMKGYKPELAWHMAKIIECGALCAKPASPSDALLGIIDDDAFYLKPLDEKRKCTEQSAMAHTLYENTNPFVIEEPDGTLILNDAKYEQYDEKTVKINGAKWIERKKTTIKLEGAKLSGYRTIAIAGVRNPLMIEQIDKITEDIKRQTEESFDSDFEINFRLYGKNGVLGEMEFLDNPYEIGVIVDVVANSQSLAHKICSVAKSNLQHYDYKNRTATGANVAFPYSPAEFDLGEVYEFSIYHILETDNVNQCFSIEEIGL